MKTRVECLLEQLPQGIDGMLVTSEVGRRYFTGLHSSAGTLLMLRDAGAFFIIDFRYIEKARAVIRDAQVIRQEALYKQIAALAKQHGVKKLAVEGDYMTVSDCVRWRERVADVEFVNTPALNAAILQMRMVKSAEELDAICAAQKITDNAFTHILDYIRPGRTDQQVACELLDYTYRHGSERPAFDFIVVSGKNSSMPHGVPTDKVIEPGDFITMDFGCVVNGYCSDMTRTVAVGKISEEQRRVYEVVLNAHMAALAAVKPGIRCREVDAAARDLIAAAGYGSNFGHSTGHSLGLEIHEAPTFSSMDETLCKPGMVVTVEPGIYLEGRFGVRIENMVLVTEEGGENLTHSDRKLIVLG